MMIDFLGAVPIPEFAGELRKLYWHRRAVRSGSVPTLRTWQRRIRTEKHRLIGLGVCPFELHLVCRILACGRGDDVRQFEAERRYLRFMARKQCEVRGSVPV